MGAMPRKNLFLYFLGILVDYILTASVPGTDRGHGLKSTRLPRKVPAHDVIRSQRWGKSGQLHQIP